MRYTKNLGIIKNTKYFFGLVKYNFIIYLIINFVVGLLDGIGLILFIPIITNFTNPSKKIEFTNTALSHLLALIKNIGVPINLTSLLLLIFFIFICKGIIKGIQIYYLATIRYKIMTKLRKTLLTNLNNLSYEGYLKVDNGTLQNNFTVEITKVYSNMTNLFLAYQSFVMGLTYFMLAYLVNPKLAIIIILTSTIIRISLNKTLIKTECLSKINSAKANELNQGFIQSILNFKYLNATNNLKKYSKKINEIVNEMEITNFKMGKYQSLIEGIKEPLAVGVIILLLILQIEFFGILVNSILISLVLLYKVLLSFNTLNSSIQVYQQTVGNVDSVKNINKYLLENQIKETGNKVLKTLEKIEIKNITIAYGNSLVLANINLIIKKYDRIAFIGESGSGKTSIINHIMGLQKPYNGEIIINNNNLQNYQKSELNKKIGYISQQNVMFNDTIFNNVTMFERKNKENLEKFWHVIKMVSLHSFVIKTAQSEDTIIGDNGESISGGQRQRIAIARELYKEPELLIMDEATSALDYETEKTIKENLETLKNKCTIIIIAHRFNTLKHMDKIILLGHNTILEQGTYSELLANSTIFRKMITHQKL